MNQLRFFIVAVPAAKQTTAKPSNANNCGKILLRLLSLSIICDNEKTACFSGKISDISCKT